MAYRVTDDHIGDFGAGRCSTKSDSADSSSQAVSQYLLSVRSHHD